MYKQSTKLPIMKYVLGDQMEHSLIKIFLRISDQFKTSFIKIILRKSNFVCFGLIVTQTDTLKLVTIIIFYMYN